MNAAQVAALALGGFATALISLGLGLAWNRIVRPHRRQHDPHTGTLFFQLLTVLELVFLLWRQSRGEDVTEYLTLTGGALGVIVFVSGINILLGQAKAARARREKGANPPPPPQDDD